MSWNKTVLGPIWSEVWGEELDDHEEDDGTDFDQWENTNLASPLTNPNPTARDRAAISELHGVVRRHFG